MDPWGCGTTQNYTFNVIHPSWDIYLICFWTSKILHQTTNRFMTQSPPVTHHGGQWLDCGTWEHCQTAPAGCIPLPGSDVLWLQAICPSLVLWTRAQPIRNTLMHFGVTLGHCTGAQCHCTPYLWIRWTCFVSNTFYDCRIYTLRAGRSVRNALPKVLNTWPE